MYAMKTFQRRGAERKLACTQNSPEATLDSHMTQISLIQNPPYTVIIFVLIQPNIYTNNTLTTRHLQKKKNNFGFETTSEISHSH